MTKYIFFLISIFTFYTKGNCQSTEKSLENPDELVSCLMQSLKSGKDSMILNCLPNKQEYTYLIENFYRRDSTPVDTIIKSIEQAALVNMAQLIEGSRSYYHINWDEQHTTINKVIVQEYTTDYDTIKGATLTIHISANDNNYILKLRECIKLNGHWKIYSDIIFEEGEKPLSLQEQLEQDTLGKLRRDTALYFPRTKFQKVIAYTFNKGLYKEDSGEEESIYNEYEKKLAKSIVSLYIVLTKQETDTLLKLLNDTNMFERYENMMRGYIPHCAFVFYNGADTPVAYVNISFMCHQVTAKPSTYIINDGIIIDAGRRRLQNFCRDIGIPVDSMPENYEMNRSKAK